MDSCCFLVLFAPIPPSRESDLGPNFVNQFDLKFSTLPLFGVLSLRATFEIACLNSKVIDYVSPKCCK